ncbi:hypothetical protein AAG570_004875 [Ranatra chinensis]|uniref:Endonuclease/exonuclease/phosphatase domain-containing protein n=1 Tax=Ranatra chinensis TaxID=642074 RepID=A0ABD0XYU2_9HEMI
MMEEVLRLRKRAQRRRDPVRGREARALYRDSLRRYKSAIKSAQTRNWQEFLTAQGADTPWGLPYRLCRGLSRGHCRRDVSELARFAEAGHPIRFKGLLEKRAAEAPILESVTEEQQRSTVPEDKEWIEVRNKKKTKKMGSDTQHTKRPEQEKVEQKRKEEGNRASKLTYSSVIKRATKHTKVSDDKVVLLCPKEEVVKKIKPVENKLHINAVRKTRGGGLLVLTNDAKSADVIRKAMTESAQVKKPGYNTEPRVLIYDVPKSMKPDEIQQSVHAQNTFEGVTHKEFKRLFQPLRVCTKKLDRNPDTNNWVVAVSGAIRNNLQNGRNLQALQQDLPRIKRGTSSKCTAYRQRRMLKIVQINAMRAQRVVYELRQQMCSHKIDVALIEEPYTVQHKVAGHSAGDRVFACPEERQPPWAAILIRNRHIDATLLGDISSPYCVAVQVRFRAGKIILISAYFPPSRAEGPLLESLGGVLHAREAAEILIGADVNARSTLWHDVRINRRGEEVMDFVLDNRLEVVNLPTTLTTYLSRHGTSNVDITLAT